VKKSFRIGLRLGVLGGMVMAVVYAVRGRRSAQAPMATGVHGQWPPVARADTAPVHKGDHHPAGRVQVPAEAAPMGAPPAISGPDNGLPAEPEVPVPKERLEASPAGSSEAGGTPPGRAVPAPPAKKAAAKKSPPAQAPAPTAGPAKKAAAKSGARKATAKPATTPAPPPWVAPEGQSCPASHPVKAKLSSRLFHLPGMFAYNRTLPDRCYLDAASAEADGLTQAKR
jgi:hypothetical protein